MRMLALKAWRDLAHLRGQSLAIALVIASGVAMLVMAQSTYHSLEGTRARFYADYAFADVWAGAKRAPEALAARLADIPGVQTVETRVAAPATLVLADFADLSGYEVYACGAPVMVAAAKRDFTARGLPEDAFFSDSFEFQTGG